MKIRVPSGQFSNFMESIAKLGVVTGKSIQTKDVSLTIADFDALIKSLQSKEESLKQERKDQADTARFGAIDDQLANINLEIERVRAQQSAMNQLADLSTIDVTLVQAISSDVSPADPHWYSQTLAGATSSFMTVFRGVATLVTWVVMFCPFWLPPALFALAVYRRKTVITPQ